MMDRQNPYICNTKWWKRHDRSKQSEADFRRLYLRKPLGAFPSHYPDTLGALDSRRSCSYQTMFRRSLQVTGKQGRGKMGHGLLMACQPAY